MGSHEGCSGDLQDLPGDGVAVSGAAAAGLGELGDRVGAVFGLITCTAASLTACRTWRAGRSVATSGRMSSSPNSSSRRESQGGVQIRLDRVVSSLASVDDLTRLTRLIGNPLLFLTHQIESDCLGVVGLEQLAPRID